MLTIQGVRKCARSKIYIISEKSRIVYFKTIRNILDPHLANRIELHLSITRCKYRRRLYTHCTWSPQNRILTRLVKMHFVYFIKSDIINRNWIVGHFEMHFPKIRGRYWCLKYVCFAKYRHAKILLFEDDYVKLRIFIFPKIQRNVWESCC